MVTCKDRMHRHAKTECTEGHGDAQGEVRGRIQMIRQDQTKAGCQNEIYQFSETAINGAQSYQDLANHQNESGNFVFRWTSVPAKIVFR